MFETKVCKICKKPNKLLEFPQDYYLFVYVRDLAKNVMEMSDYRTYFEPSFDCEHCHKRSRVDMSKEQTDKLVIFHENEETLNYRLSEK